MGRDKRRISIYGSTLLERACRLMENVLAREPVIAASNLEEEYIYGCRVIDDAVGGNGPMDGLVSCLRDSGTDWILVIPVDMPFLDASLLEMLLKSASNEFDAVLIESGGKLEPLLAMYNRKALSYWENCLTSGQLSIQQCVKNLSYKTISVPESQRSLVNLNSERDLIKILPDYFSQFQISQGSIIDPSSFSS